MKTHQTRRPGSETPQERGFQEYLAVMIRGRWIIITTFLVVLVATILITKLTPPTFQATCKVLLNPAELRSTLFLDAVRPDGVKNIVQNELAILNSRALMDSVAERLRRMKFLNEDVKEYIPMVRPGEGGPKGEEVADLPEVSGRVMGAVDFDPVRDSDIIQITARSRNSREAALVANVFAQAYRDRNIYMSRAKSRSFREFLEKQALEKRKQLEETEGSLQNYMEQQGVVSMDDETRRMIDQLAQLEAQRDATDITLKELQNTLGSYQAQLPQQETNVARVVGEASDTYIRQMQEQLSRLEVQRDMAIVQNPSSGSRDLVNEKVREIDQQIASLRLKLQKRTDDFLRTLTAGEGGDAAGYLKTVKQKILESEITVSALAAKKRALNEAIAEYEQKVDKLPQKTLALARLQRSRLSNEKLYLMVEEKYNEANITEQSNIGYIEIIEPASPPSSPSSPKTLVNIGLGMVLGIVLGLVLAFVKEYFDVRVHTPEDLKRHGFTPLTPIMNIDAEIQRLGGGKLSVKGKQADPHLVLLTYPFSMIAESYRQMRTTLQFAKTGHAAKSFLITSPSPGEGKTTTASNLAIAFAQAGKRALLVDADLRRPTLAARFSLNKGPGLTDLLEGRVTLRNAAQPTAVNNLFILASGDIPTNPAEVLGSDAMRAFVESASKEFDVVIFDSSPLLAVTDPAVIATMVEGAVFVVGSGKARLQDLVHASQLLEAVGGKVLGVVLNIFDPIRAYGLAVRRAGRYRYQYARKADGSGETGSEAPASVGANNDHKS